ncbi:hypothetical protein RI129_010841 [Pyrocoelia pectoralis]|uniref:Cytochrome P450 n=1 Tax=Pyrocoelia pectoralis TaxID=417401 RepID=A0AAN7UZM2_9COLE
MIYAVVLIIIIIILLFLVALFMLPSLYWYWKGVDTVSPITYLANIFKKEPLCLILQHFYNTLKGRGKKFGGYYFLGRPIFVPTDLDLIKKMLNNDFDHFSDHIGYVDAEKNPLSLHVFNTRGCHWKKIRSKLTPSFTSVKCRTMFDTALKCAQDFNQLVIKCTDRNEPIDIRDVSERFTTDAIVSYVFGVESKALRNATSEFRRLTTELLKSFRMMLLVFCPEPFGLFKIGHFGQDITNFYTNLVKQTDKYRKENGIVREDYIHHLLKNRSDDTITDCDVNETKVKSYTGLSLSEIAAQCFIIYMAGFETSAAAISYTLAELALNQEIQNKVREEIKAVLGNHNRKITYEAIQEMEYLNKCLYETLRKYPLVPTNTRLCTKSYKIPNSDVVINEGTYVFLPTYALHRDPEYFPDPEKYDPDRFSMRSAKIRQHSAFLPFGDGPRKCIGK